MHCNFVGFRIFMESPFSWISLFIPVDAEEVVLQCSRVKFSWMNGVVPFGANCPGVLVIFVF